MSTVLYNGQHHKAQQRGAPQEVPGYTYQDELLFPALPAPTQLVAQSSHSQGKIQYKLHLVIGSSLTFTLAMAQTSLRRKLTSVNEFSEHPCYLNNYVLFLLISSNIWTFFSHSKDSRKEHKYKVFRAHKNICRTQQANFHALGIPTAA